MRVRDPVCGMVIDLEHAARLAHGTATFHFCAPGCMESFRHDPERFIHAADWHVSRAIAVLEEHASDPLGIYREFQTLSAAVWDVLSHADPSFDRAKVLMETVDRRIHIAGFNHR